MAARTSFLLALFFCAIGVLAQDLSKPIDFTCRATALPKLLDQLSKLSGVNLKSTQEFDNEPIILRLRQVSLQEVMDKIADSLAGEWVKRENVIELRRSGAAKIRHQETVDQNASALRSLIDKLAVTSGADKVFQQNDANRVASSYAIEYINPDQTSPPILDGPVQRLLAKLLQQIDLKRVVTLPVYRKAVFATHPTSLQFGIRDADALVERFADDQNMVVKQVSHIAESQNSEVKQLLRETMHECGEPIQTLLKVEKVPTGYEATIRVFFADGNTYDTSQSLDTTRLVDPADVNFVKDQLRAGLNISDRTKHYIALGNRSGWRRDPRFSDAPVPPDLWQEVISPAEYDPLSHVTTDIVLDIAEREKSNVVVVPTDTCETYIQGRKLRNGRIFGGSPDLVLEDMVLTWFRDMQIDRTEGWLLGKPKDPLSATEVRMPRALLQDLLQAINEKGFIPLDELGRFCLELQADIPFSEIVKHLRRVVDRDPTYYDKSAFAFLSTLTDAQMQLAENGGLHLTVSAMSELQARLLCEMGLSPILLSTMKSTDESGFWPLDMEPTQTMASFLDGGYTEVRSKTETTYAFELIEGRRRVVRNHLLESFARIVYDSHSEKPRWRANLDAIRISTKQTISVSIAKRGRYHFVGTIAELVEDAPPEGMPKSLQQILDEMDPQTRAQYNAYLRQIHEDELRARKEKQDTKVEEPPPAKPPRYAYLRGVQQ